MAEKEKKIEHKIEEYVRSKNKPPRTIGHNLSDKRPHFKTFKSPGVR